MEPTQHTAQSLKQTWENLKTAEPKLRIRDASSKLGVSEAELLATGIDENVIRLTSNFASQLVEFPKLGRIMSLTRSEGCVLENKGPFQKIELHQAGTHKMATVIGPIELRIFFAGWRFGFAVTTDTARGTMKSLQYFDQEGVAILKVYLQEESSEAAYNEIITNHTSMDQSSELELESFPPENTISLNELDIASFTHDWENMKDTHDFFGMLRNYKLNRQDAVTWINDKWAYEIDKLSARKIVATAIETKLPIMIFAGNKGTIQIHQGKVQNAKQLGEWYNILDPNFNMHLDESQIDKAYVVHKNTEDGLVSAVEFFDSKKVLIAQFFGLRKPGLPQKPEWKALVDSLK